jgi:hypothetical protein
MSSRPPLKSSCSRAAPPRPTTAPPCSSAASSRPSADPPCSSTSSSILAADRRRYGTSPLVARTRLPETRETRWAVTFTSSICPDRSPVFQDGFLKLWRDASRLVLVDAHNIVVDSRYLHDGEVVAAGDCIDLPVHSVHIPYTYVSLSSSGSAGMCEVACLICVFFLNTEHRSRVRGRVSHGSGWAYDGAS